MKEIVVCQDQKDPRESRVSKDLLETKEFPAIREIEDRKDHREGAEFQDLMENLVNREKSDFREETVLKVMLDLLEKKDVLDDRDHGVNQDLQENKVHRDIQEQWDLRDQSG